MLKNICYKVKSYFSVTYSLFKCVNVSDYFSCHIYVETYPAMHV